MNRDRNSHNSPLAQLRNALRVLWQRQRRQWTIFQTFLIGLGLAIALSFFNPATVASFESDSLNEIADSHPRPNEEQSSASASIQLAQGLDDQGRSLYESGQYDSAVQVLQQSIEAYAAQGDTLRQSVALSNLSLTYQQLGALPEAEDAIATSLSLLNALPIDSAGQQSVMAQTLMVQGRLQFTQGALQEAYETWVHAEDYYDDLENTVGLVESRINQAQSLRDQGFYQRALDTLQELEPIVEQEPDGAIKVLTLRSLGDAYYLTGVLDESKTVLEASVELAEQLALTEPLAETLLSLGNTERARFDEAVRLGENIPEEESIPENLEESGQILSVSNIVGLYERAATISDRPSTQIQAKLNQLSFLISNEVQEWRDASALIPQIQSQLATLPLGRESIFHRIDFASSAIAFQQRVNTLAPESDRVSIPMPDLRDIAQILVTANQQAQQLNDGRSQAYAIGMLGNLYEALGQYEEAQTVTERALVSAQATNATDITYRWQWQLGRIYKAQEENDLAIEAYKEAISLLDDIRNDLSTRGDASVQFSFRDSVEPVYRELVDLLLSSGEEVVEGTNAELANSQLKEARDIIEGLQVAELNNFFRSNCLDVQSVEVDEIDNQSAVIYPVILEDRLATILTVPGEDPNTQRFRQYSINLPRTEIEAEVKFFQEILKNDPTDRSRYLESARRIYDWLIRPLEPELVESLLSTLVFVPDGVLQNIPMAALHNGERFLIEDYAIAVTPGLQLTETQALQETQLSTLKAGISEFQEEFSNFPALEGVLLEFDQIQQVVPAGEVLLNQEFTTDTFRSIVNEVPFPIVHLATHGVFSSDLDETYLLAWGSRIGVEELRVTLLASDLERDNPVELLVLSACETAEGDPRAALGLAGIAIGSGARSTVASLWLADDQATVILISQFYNLLATGNLSKAEALRQAQVFMINETNDLLARPQFWANFVLIGNWA